MKESIMKLSNKTSTGWDGVSSLVFKNSVDCVFNTLKNSKRFPKHICKVCQEDLEKAHDFRTRCINAQKYFHSTNYVAAKKTEALEIKDEVDEKIIPQNWLYHSEIEIKDELPIEERSISEFCFVKTENKDVFEEDERREVALDDDRASSSSNNRDDSRCSAKLIEKPTQGKTPPEINGEEKKLHDEVIPAAAHKVKRQYTKRVKDPDKEIKKNEGRPKKAPPKKIKTETDKTFICDQCGSYFNCKTNFLTHQRRHAGDKAFQCEICPEKFFLHQALKRHMCKHTGERPFPCRYCDRRFIDYSARCKHERTHTNERPFACTQCSKAFANSYILKNHMLSHTGERSFRCDLCDKSFGRKIHLVTHYRSMMHKQNEEKNMQETSNEHTNNYPQMLGAYPTT